MDAISYSHICPCCDARYGEPSAWIDIEMCQICLASGKVRDRRSPFGYMDVKANKSRYSSRREKFAADYQAKKASRLGP